MTSLPPLSQIQVSPSGPKSPLAAAISILFEHSPILVSLLEPQLHQILKSSAPLTSYEQLIDLSLEELSKWEIPEQSEFISGHPRIGESANLSKLSAKEQGANAIKPTPPEVLARLAHLNAAYEIRYPGLRYITFVNGRSRAAIAEEMEDVLGLEHSLSPNEPPLSSIQPIKRGERWLAELKRAVEDVGRIGKSRLGSLGAA